MNNPLEKTKANIWIESLNASTHGLGVLFSLIALPFLFWRAGMAGGWPAILLITVYGFGFVAMFLASTLYHAFSFSRYRRLMRHFDHSAIFLMIAGSYSPFCFWLLPSRRATFLGLALWLATLAGIVVKNLSMTVPAWLQAGVYLLFGWVGLLLIPEMLRTLAPISWKFLLAGALAYSLGSIFYALKRWPVLHIIWHLFVLAGAIFMFFAIYLSIG